MRGLPFQLDGQCVMFEKADAPDGKRRRIAGVISTETLDRQNEVVIQEGLDLNPFINHGWFNDNHSKDTDGIVGYPEEVRQFQKGDRLPNGQIATSNCTWAEGHLLEGSSRAEKIWELGNALSKTNGQRALGFSIEGTVDKRIGADRKVVAKATVMNCAITNCPVNTDTKLEILAKSLLTVQTLPDYLELLEKTLTMGTPASPPNPPVGPAQGEGAGQILVPESLDSKARDIAGPVKKKKKKKLSKAEATEWFRNRLKNASEEQITKLVELVFKKASAQ